MLSPLKKVFNFYRDLIKDNKVWLLLTAGIFASGAITGAIVTFLAPSLAEQVINSYAASIDIEVKVGWDLTWYIFERNLLITTIASFLGLIFGIIPGFVTYVNGFALGVVFTYLPAAGGVSPLQILLLTLPHGIFEYFGSVLVISFGLRLGVNWMLSKSGQRKSQIFVGDLKKLIAIYPLSFVVLLFAAIVEGVFTTQISCLFGGLCV